MELAKTHAEVRIAGGKLPTIPLPTNCPGCGVGLDPEPSAADRQLGDFNAPIIAVEPVQLDRTERRGIERQGLLGIAHRQPGGNVRDRRRATNGRTR